MESRKDLVQIITDEIGEKYIRKLYSPRIEQLMNECYINTSFGFGDLVSN
jgi:hypothetical protein